MADTMFALLQKGDGYCDTATGPQIESANDWLEAAEIPVPTPGSGQVLIKVLAASVNPSDLHFIKGEYGQPRVKGTPAGFEGCGEVVEIAGDGGFVQKGMRVAFVAGKGGSGAWAEYAVADAMGCIPLRDDISDEDGAAQIVNPLTAMAMVDIAEKAGDALVITAATSQLGKLMIGLAKDKGLKAIATVRRDDAIPALKALGAAEVLNTEAPDFLDSAKAAFKEIKPTVMLDAVSDQTSSDMFFAMPAGARWVTYGKLSADLPKLTEMGQFIFMNKRIEGFWLTMWFRDTPPGDQMKTVAEVQARFADGRWKTDISEVLPLRDVMEKLPAALKKPDGKVIIKP
ncbi:alcohol dehydrogenase catalytic domain-containing protein [Parasulfitobacter algicola]|uniref:Zinc-binding dehydrogenase n=1 Tax=Parasulfitobacter algicola TaxID=2614809 RepID=A0ABX2ISP8_9RHOB|nr:zinc-binding dehydrogenase [Sulfitobacter algicola]NSX54100.1 zinc-binding dehydrogenase [Sulfitobacter algicola]